MANNYGGGIYCRINSSPIVERCVFILNTAAGCGGLGGGIAAFDGNPQIINCTFNRNDVELNGGAVYFANCPNSIITNTIICGGDSSSAVHLEGSASMEISYCDFYDNASGNFTGSVPAGIGEIVTVNSNDDSCDIFNNIYSDPLFYSTIGDSAYYLTEDSPCIDAGDPESPADPDNTIADIGAFYFYQSSAMPDISVSVDSLIFIPTVINNADSLFLTIYNIGTSDLVIDSLVCVQFPQVFSTSWDTQDSIIIPEDSLVICCYFAPEDTLDYIDYLCIYNNDEMVEIYLEGEGLPYVAVNNGESDIPDIFILYPPNPNPFNSSTVLRFVIPGNTQVNLSLYDICGRAVECISDEIFPVGEHSVTLDASQLPSGLYFVRFYTKQYQQTLKLLLIK